MTVIFFVAKLCNMCSFMEMSSKNLMIRDISGCTWEGADLTNYSMSVRGWGIKWKLLPVHTVCEAASMLTCVSCKLVLLPVARVPIMIILKIMMLIMIYIFLSLVMMLMMLMMIMIMMTLGIIMMLIMMAMYAFLNMLIIFRYFEITSYTTCRGKSFVKNAMYGVCYHNDVV